MGRLVTGGARSSPRAVDVTPSAIEGESLLNGTAAGSHPGEPLPPASEDAALSSRMARSASTLVVRQVVVQLLSAASTAVLARVLGVASFGAYSAGMATYYLLLSVCDFGFGTVLARELGAGRPDDGSLARSMLQVQTAWSVAVACLGAAIAIASGLGLQRSDVLLVLVPTMALTGFSGARQVFYANYKTSTLGLVDIIGNVGLSVAVTATALFTKDPVWIAAAFCSLALINTIAVRVVAGRYLDAGGPTREARRRLLRMALPLGAASLLASAYFTLDLSIVSYLVSKQQVGFYAAATKALTVLVTIPGLVMTAALAGLSKTAADREHLGQLVARVWHWLSAVVLPVCVAVMVFAGRLVELYFGDDYRPAVGLVRILAASAIIALLSNVFGTAMVAAHRTRWLVVQGTAALVFNVAGNLLLVPRFGVTASAWLTVATEALVCVGSVVGIRGRLYFRPLIRRSLAPVTAVAGLVAVGVPLAGHVFVGIPASGLAFLFILVLLGGWPEDLPRIDLRRHRPRPMSRFGSHFRRAKRTEKPGRPVSR